MWRPCGRFSNRDRWSNFPTLINWPLFTIFRRSPVRFSLCDCVSRIITSRVRRDWVLLGCDSDVNGSLAVIHGFTYRWVETITRLSKEKGDGLHPALASRPRCHGDIRHIPMASFDGAEASPLPSPVRTTLALLACVRMEFTPARTRVANSTIARQAARRGTRAGCEEQFHDMG